MAYNREAQQRYRASEKGKARTKETQAAWRAKNRHLQADRDLRRKYGITLEEYNKRLTAQGGRCGMCRTDKPGGVGRFHVDHDHACCPGRTSCGKCLRALLCHNCNTGLRTPGFHHMALQYLEQF